MSAEGFNNPPPPDDIESNESTELTLEEKYWMVGRKDSILDLRGVHISISRLNELLPMLDIKDKTDLMAVADLVERKHAETMGKGVNEAILNEEQLFVRMERIRTYVIKYGINDFATELIREWELQYKRVFTSEVNKEGQVIATIRFNLNLSELYTAGNESEKANKFVIEAHKIAVLNEQSEWAKMIESEFPKLVKHF